MAMSPSKRLHLKRKLVEYEPMSPLDYQNFKEFKLEKLVSLIRQNFHSDWKKFPYTEKYYHGCGQVFVKKFVKLVFCRKSLLTLLRH